MRSIITETERTLRELISGFDYLTWLILDPSKFEKINKEKIKKTAIIHLGAMGELIISTPILPVLKKELVTKVYYFVEPGKEDVLKNNPNIDKIVIWNKDNSENFKLLKREKFDMVIILWPGFPSLSYMCMKAGIKYRIGVFKNIKDGLNFFFTRRILDLRTKNAVESNVDFIRTIGLNNPSPKLEIFLSTKEKKERIELLKKYHLKDYVIIHPGFSFSDVKYPSRFWPPERYAEAADHLIKKGYKIVLTGNNSEQKFSDEIYKRIKNKKSALVLNGKLSLRELFMIVSSSSLVLCPGTGVLHIASAFDRKIIALMGKESPKEWHPWTDQSNYKVMFHNEVCTECDKNYCRKKTQECVLSITSKEVIKASDELLKD